MEIGFDMYSVVSDPQFWSGQWVIFAGIVVAGYFGRLIAVSFGFSLASGVTGRNVSGFKLVGLSAALFVGVVFVAGKQDRALHLLQQTIIDPVTAWVL